MGTVYIGLCSPQAVSSKRFVFSGSRQEVRFRACLEALRMLVDVLERWLFVSFVRFCIAYENKAASRMWRRFVIPHFVSLN